MTLNIISESKHKDQDPKSTLKNIKSILNSLDITVYEKTWYNYKDYSYSVRIQVDGFPNVGMNGKGTTRNYALASAYGELMERLQNRNLFFRKYGLKPAKNSFPDEKIIDSESFQKLAKHLGDLLLDYPNEDIRNFIKQESSSRVCAPFLNLINGEIQYLPTRFISIACGTNGMCAGNSEAEALAHGLGEIFERYVSKEIVLKRKLLPTIPLSVVKNENLFNSIKYLQGLGYDVKIKDCTLGGKYPVVGLLVMNDSKTKFQLKLGSDSIFDIALERCLTEVFQGFDLSNFHKCLLPLTWDSDNSDLYSDIEKICKDGSKAFPDSVLYDSKETYCLDPFLEKHKSNEASLSHLVEIIKNEDKAIFVRNYSFLDFPSYKVYVPGMSEIYLRNTNDVNYKYNTAKAASYLLRIKECGDNELKELAEHISESLNRNESAALSKNTIFKSMSLYISDESEFLQLDLRLIVSLILYKLQNYTKAVKYFEEYISDISERDYINMSYYMGICAYMNYKREGNTEVEIYQKLNSIYSPQAAEEIIQDMSNINNLFDGFDLPNCPNCDHCNIKYECKFLLWEKQNENLNHKINQFYYKNEGNSAFLQFDCSNKKAHTVLS